MTAIERLLESGSIGLSTRGVGGLLLWGIARCAPRERVIACRAPRKGSLRVVRMFRRGTLSLHAHRSGT